MHFASFAKTTKSDIDWKPYEFRGRGNASPMTEETSPTLIFGDFGKKQKQISLLCHSWCHVDKRVRGKKIGVPCSRTSQFTPTKDQSWHETVWCVELKVTTFKIAKKNLDSSVSTFKACTSWHGTLASRPVQCSASSVEGTQQCNGRLSVVDPV